MASWINGEEWIPVPSRCWAVCSCCWFLLSCSSMEEDAVRMLKSSSSSAFLILELEWPLEYWDMNGADNFEGRPVTSEVTFCFCVFFPGGDKDEEEEELKSKCRISSLLSSALLVPSSAISILLVWEVGIVMLIVSNVSVLCWHIWRCQNVRSHHQLIKSSNVRKRALDEQIGVGG